MKKLLLSLFLTFTGMVNSQVLIEYDYMETSSTNYLTAGWFIPAVTAGWFTNAFVSSNTSAVIYGLGSGTSGLEQDWYVLPNITGLDVTKQYQLRFRLASYTFSNSTATSRGVDVNDFVDVQVSTNGGISYISELRIVGNNNATWPYTSTGIVTHTANGTFTNAAAPAGDVYQPPAGASTTAPTFITLNLPTNITQVAIDILCRVNAAGEEWWIDNIELLRIDPLPVELTLFEGFNTENGNLLIWKTATENNSDYYLIERSTTGEFTEKSVIGQKLAAGNSTEEITYTFVDNEFTQTVNYYRITQVDKDGQFKVYGPISINNNVEKKIVKIINMMGQECIPTQGVYFEVYDDGTLKKVYKN
jgi:hypothetical protein